MTTETEVDQENTQVEDQSTDATTDEVVNSEEDNSAFESGFNKSRGEESPDESPDETAGSDDDKPEITDKQASALFAGKSAEEIQDLFNRVPGLETRLSDETRKLYGRFGDVQSRLQKIEERANGASLDVAIEDFEELAGEYPEFTELLIAGLKKSLARGKPAEQKQSGQPVDVSAIVEAAVNKVREEQDVKFLTVMHNDWKTLPNEKEFHLFLSSLPGDPVAVTRADGSTIQLPAKAAEYVDSNDAMVAAECFTKYKSWKSSQKPARKTNRLEAAITPQGRGTPPDSTIDDNAAFIAGFKKARGTG